MTKSVSVRSAIQTCFIFNSCCKIFGLLSDKGMSRCQQISGMEHHLVIGKSSRRLDGESRGCDWKWFYNGALDLGRCRMVN